MGIRELGSGEGCKLGADDPAFERAYFAGEDLAEAILEDGGEIRVGRTVGISSLKGRMWIPSATEV